MAKTERFNKRPVQDSERALQGSEEQIEIALRIHNLRMKVEGEGYWKPKYGDWVMPLTEFNYKAKHIELKPHIIKKWQGEWGNILVARLEGDEDVWWLSRDCFPLLAWADCRALLGKMGWYLDKFYEMLDPTGKALRVPQWITLYFKKPGMRLDDHAYGNGPDDLTAIHEVLLEVLKRKWTRMKADKAKADKEEKDA